MFVDGVIEAPRGAHFTDCAPDYGRDEALQREYAEAAGNAEKWARFQEKYLG
jgi:glutaconate CoA-transferase subunit A